MPREASGPSVSCRARVHEMQDADTVFVGDESDGAAILREIEFINVPRDVFGEHGELAFFEVEALQALKFGVLVRATKIDLPSLANCACE